MANGYVEIERFVLPQDRPSRRIPHPSPETLQLAESAGIEALPPVIYREAEGGRYEILSGAETWMAAQKLRIPEVPARPGPQTEALQARLLALEYGIRGRWERIRETIVRYREGERPADLARRYQVDRTLIWHWIRMESLAPEVWEAMESGEITEGHGRLLCRLPRARQREWLVRLRSNRIPVSRLRAALSKTGAKPVPEKVSGGGEGMAELDPATAAAIRDLETRGSEYLGSPVEIRHRKDGGGELVVRYADLDVLQGILERTGIVEPEY